MKKSGRGSKGIEGRRAVCSERDRLVYDGERGGTAHFFVRLSLLLMTLKTERAACMHCKYVHYISICIHIYIDYICVYIYMYIFVNIDI